MRRLAVRAASALLLVMLAAGLPGCGGGDAADEVPPQPPTAPTVGSDGGTVSGSVGGTAGVTVVVPPGALQQPATIRIATDATGAPEVPAWFEPAGPMVAITPHGATFSERVTVRLPAPHVTLADDERLLIAKAQPGGEWEVFADTRLNDAGQLEVQVDSFSIFVVGRVKLQTTIVQPGTPAAFDVGPVTLLCDGQPCASPDLLRPMTITARTTGNGGPFPANCVNPQFQFRASASIPRVSVPASPSGVFEQSFQMPYSDVALFNPALNASGYDTTLYITPHLVCTDPATNASSALMLSSRGTIGFNHFGRGGHAPTLVRFPTAITAALGETPALTAILVGGASVMSGAPTVRFSAPDAQRQAFVYLERRRNGDSWRTLETHGQTEANSTPTGGVPWMYWSLGFHLPPVTPDDSTSSFRLRACFQPPSATVSECSIGPEATLTIVQHAALPSFTTQPRSVLIRPGETASFTAQVAGTPAPTLQWQWRSSAQSSAWNDASPNGNAANYTTPPMAPADTGVQYRLLASNSAGSVASEIATVSVGAAPAAPVITTQPTPISVARGSEAMFAVGATGTEAISYQWFKGGVAITGANAPQLRMAYVGDADTGTYSVEVTNAAGTVASTPARLTVTAAAPGAVAPSIQTQPAAVAVTEGNVATFAVGVAGSGPMTFQWRKNGSNIVGATAAAYTIAAVTVADAGTYSVVVGNAVGNTTSQAATLAVAPATGTPVLAPPVIAVPPSGLVVAPGMSGTLGVTAQGSGPLAYRWFRNGAEVVGQTGASYTIAAASALDVGTYRVEVSNAAGTVLSGGSQVLLLGAPAITTQPVAATATEGLGASFSVAASGDVLRYQWLRNGVAIAGADAASYTTPALTLADSGAVYGVIVYNGAGLVFSNGAVLTVTAAIVAPSVTLQPVNLTVTEGTPANIDVAFGGTAPFTVRIERNVAGSWSPIASDAPVPDNNPIRMATTNLSAADNGVQFRIVGCNAAGCITTHTITVTVPHVVLSTDPAAKLALGAAHACAVKADYTVVCWGANNQGQLGNGGTLNASAPVAVAGLNGVIAVAVGSRGFYGTHWGQSCAVQASGALWCWGRDANAIDQLVPQAVAGVSDARAVAVGSGHACYLDAAGRVHCWGFNISGELGNGTVGNPQPAPALVQRDGATLTGIAAIGAGDSWTCALATNGSVLCWGVDHTGNAEFNPMPVAGVSGATLLAVGPAHACAVVAGGAVRCWGYGGNGQLGNGGTAISVASVAVTGLADVTALAAGSTHTCARRSSGDVVCWGSANLGNGSSSSTTPGAAVTGLSDVSTLSAGLGASCALRSDGQVLCWGSNFYGQLGVGDTADRAAPTATAAGAAFWHL